ncbi:unnamed protein product, partial [Ixodes persulcatus]
MANPGSSGARACYCPRYAPRKKSEGERGGDRALGSPGRDRAASAGRSGRRTGGGDRRGSGDGRRDLGRALAASGSVPVTPRIRNPRPFLLREERQLAGETPQRAPPESEFGPAVSTAGSPHRSKEKKCGDASVAAGVPTLLSLAVIDQLRRRVGPGATVVCAARAPWGSGRLPPAKARRWSLLLLEKRPLRWWRRRREAARADVRFFLRGSCQSAGSERGRGARLPHTNRARRKNAELETRRTDARRRKKKQALGGAHAPAALPRPDWPGVTWLVT